MVRFSLINKGQNPAAVVFGALEDVEFVVLETDGSFGVIPKTAEAAGACGGNF
jgi:hypothetical protein